jgi:hypothetical protein
MASVIHFKFKNDKDFQTVTFDGLFIALPELKRQICQQKYGKAGTLEDLSISNAQTNEGTVVVFFNYVFPPSFADALIAAYSEDAHISKNTSVIVARVPITKQQQMQRQMQQNIVQASSIKPYAVFWCFFFC